MPIFRKRAKENAYLKIQVEELKASLQSSRQETQELTAKVEQKEKKEDKVRREVLKKVAEKMEHGSKRAEYLWEAFPIFKDLSSYDFKQNARLYSALTEGMARFHHVSVSAQIKGSAGIYTVSLKNCTCEDFKRTGIPCKHMYRLAIELGLQSMIDTSMIEMRLRQTAEDFNQNRIALKRIREENRRTEVKLKRLEYVESHITNVINDTSKKYPWAAKELARLTEVADLQIRDELLSKTPPAKKSAEKNIDNSKRKTDMDEKSQKP